MKYVQDDVPWVYSCDNRHMNAYGYASDDEHWLERASYLCRPQSEHVFRSADAFRFQINLGYYTCTGFFVSEGFFEFIREID